MNMNVNVDFKKDIFQCLGEPHGVTLKLNYLILL